MSRPDATNESPPSSNGNSPAAAKSDLIDRIREAADKLERDGSSRGDLKLLSRALRELRYAFKVFAPYRHVKKVTVFGSARTKPAAPSYQQAVTFGKRIAAREWMVITGAASGIMEAGHVGAGRENSMGLNILLPFEQDANPVIHGDPKLVHMNYFFTRKLMFVKECDAVVCLPGGFGTLDEALEVLTLLQTGKRDPMPLILLDEPGGGYWRGFVDFVNEHLLGGGMISPQDEILYTVTDRVDDAIEELTHFYLNYHSMRFVRENLVFRLQQAPSAELLKELNEDFTDILERGEFRVGSALPEEREQPELAELPRLIFQFDRHAHGRLRRLINRLNDSAALPAGDG